MAGRIDGRVPGLLDLDWERHLSDPGGDTSALSFLSGLGLGTLVGVLVALLLAPQPGRQIREQVRHTGIELRSRAPHRAPRSSATSHDLPTSETLADEAEHAEVELMRRMAQGDDGPAE